METIKVKTGSKDETLFIAEERFEKRVSQLEIKISEIKADLIKWMFIFVFGQFWLIVGTITGILFAFFKK